MEGRIAMVKDSIIFLAAAVFIFVLGFAIGYFVCCQQVLVLYDTGWQRCIIILEECNDCLDVCVGSIGEYNNTLCESAERIRHETTWNREWLFLVMSDA